VKVYLTKLCIYNK